MNWICSVACLADLRYRNGVESYLAVLTAQQDLYSAQQRILQSRLARLSNVITRR